MLRGVPLRAAQLFVRCKSLDELGEALGRSLPGTSAPSLLALHAEEWATVIGEAADPALARLLSERFGGALSVELDAAAFSLRVQTWEPERTGDEERDPQPPHFRDVEAVAWELLAFAGIPAQLRLLHLADVEVRPDQSALPALLVRAGPGDVMLWNVSAVPPPRPEGNEPPGAQ